MWPTLRDTLTVPYEHTGRHEPEPGYAVMVKMLQQLGQSITEYNYQTPHLTSDMHSHATICIGHQQPNFLIILI